MKLSDYKKDYYEFSKTASEVSRTAAYAGIAIIWIFRLDTQTPVPKPPSELLLPVLFFALAITADVLHYVVGTIVWRQFHRSNEKRRAEKNEDPDLEHRPWRTYLVEIFFWVKLLLVLLGYLFVCRFLFKVWDF